jgi:hypothetical protein
MWQRKKIQALLRQGEEMKSKTMSFTRLRAYETPNKEKKLWLTMRFIQFFRISKNATVKERPNPLNTTPEPGIAFPAVIPALRHIISPIPPIWSGVRAAVSMMYPCRTFMRTGAVSGTGSLL